MITKSTPLKEIIELGKECSRKNNCCKYGSGCLAEGDAEKIAKFLKISVNELKEKYLEEVEKFNTKLFRPKILRQSNKPYGTCVFFSGEECKVHEAKPLECKVGSCGRNGEELSKWFVLNYFVNANDPESIRQYALYSKKNKPLPGGSLKELVPDQKRLMKMLKFEILK